MHPTEPSRAQIGTLIVATSCVQFASGFFGTFISLRVAHEGFDATMAGLVLSAVYAGLAVGAVRSGRVIERIGHIRAYAAFAGFIIVATAAMMLWVGPLQWLVLRGIIGFGFAGLFVTTESWLNAKAHSAERGRVFALYMVGTFIALALGQLLIGRIAVETLAPFSTIIALCALALIMVSTTRADPPIVSVMPALPYGQLTRTVPVAVVGAALSGLIASSFYTLVPLWMQGRGIDQKTIGLFMLMAVLGGLAFQVPVGRFSDLFDRRAVLAFLCVGFAVVAVSLVYLPRSLPIILPAGAVLGGFMSTLYPVCVAHAHDRMEGDRVVTVTGRLILVSGCASVAGPLIGTMLIEQYGINGVLYLLAGAALLLAGFAFAGTLISSPPPHRERPFEILAPQASPLAHDPLGEFSKRRSASQ